MLLADFSWDGLFNNLPAILIALSSLFGAIQSWRNGRKANEAIAAAYLGGHAKASA